MDAQTAVRLHRHLAAMVALERSIEQRIDQLLNEGIKHPEVVSLLDRVRGSSNDRQLALTARLEAIAPEVAVPATATTPSPLEGLYDGRRCQASVAVHALMSQAVIGHAVLLELSFRAADSVEHLGPENTGDLAWEQMRACASLVQEVVRMMPYVVVDELEQEGMDCQCTCPACGLGICGCALAFRRRLDMAWADAGPIEDWPGVRLLRPRAGSPVAQAGLEKDDVLTAVDGNIIDSIPMLQDAISSHPSGEKIEFQVQRKTAGSTEVIAVPRP